MENQNQFIPPQNLIVPQTPEFIQPKPPILPQKHKMKLWKKILLSIFIIIALLGVGIYNIPRILSILYPNDDTLKDNSDLLLKKVSIPDEENGFFDLEKIGKDSLKIPKNKANISIASEYTDFTKKVEKDQDLVDKVLKDNQDYISLFDSASNKKYIQIPILSDPEQISSDTPLPSLNNWRSIAQIKSIQVMDLALNGKYDEALLEAVKLNKLGSKVINNQGTLITPLVGIAIKNIGSNTIISILSKGKFKKETLTNSVLTLENSSNTTDSYKNALKSEYMYSISNIDKIEDIIKEEHPEYNNYINSFYYLKKNKTKNLITDNFREQITPIGKECETDDSFLRKIKESNDGINVYNMIFVENAIGKLISGVLAVSFNGYINKQCQTELISNIAIIELALLSYKNDNKYLPKTLDELVPKYLGSIPLDPFDHKPIRYSFDKKILYSVGLKKKDLGGSVGDDWLKMENPTFKIEF